MVGLFSIPLPDKVGTMRSGLYNPPPSHRDVARSGAGATSLQHPPSRVGLRPKQIQILKLVPARMAIPWAAATVPGPRRGCETWRGCFADRAGLALAVKQGSPPLGAFERREAVWDLCLGQVNQRALQGD